MLGSDWSKLAKVIGLGLAGLLSFLLVLFVGYGLGSAGGYYDAQANGYAAQYPKDTDQRIDRCFSQAQSARDTQTCVQEAIESAHENSRSESDLSAQRQMAQWAFWLLIATLGGLPLTGVGLVLLLKTIWQGQEALRQAKDEARPYLFIDKFEIDRKTYSEEPDEFEGQYSVTIWLKNFGASPARNIRANHRCYITGDLADLEPLDLARGFAEAGVAAPGHHRRTFDGFFVSKELAPSFEWREAFVVLRIIYIYTDDAGNPYEEAFDYFADGEGLQKKLFYILSDRTRERARIEREQRTLFDEEGTDHDQWEVIFDEDEPEPVPIPRKPAQKAKPKPKPRLAPRRAAKPRPKLKPKEP